MTGKLAICISSRGLMHANFVDDLMHALSTSQDVYFWEFFIASGLPQPDAENDIVERALAWEPDYMIILDDDMALPINIFHDMFEMMEFTKAPAVVAHYPVAVNQDALHIRHGVFESAGMGICLLKPEVFDKLERPYFRTDTTYVWQTDHLQPYPAQPDKDYHGLFDVDFWQRLIKAGVQPAIANVKCGQYNVVNAPYRKIGNNTNLTIEKWEL